MSACPHFSSLLPRPQSPASSPLPPLSPAPSSRPPPSLICTPRAGSLTSRERHPEFPSQDLYYYFAPPTRAAPPTSCGPSWTASRTTRTSQTPPASASSSSCPGGTPSPRKGCEESPFFVVCCALRKSQSQQLLVPKPSSLFTFITNHVVLNSRGECFVIVVCLNSMDRKQSLEKLTDGQTSPTPCQLQYHAERPLSSDTVHPAVQRRRPGGRGVCAPPAMASLPTD